MVPLRFLHLHTGAHRQADFGDSLHAIVAEVNASLPHYKLDCLFEEVSFLQGGAPFNHLDSRHWFGHVEQVRAGSFDFVIVAFPVNQKNQDFEDFVVSLLQAAAEASVSSATWRCPRTLLGFPDYQAWTFEQIPAVTWQAVPAAALHGNLFKHISVAAVGDFIHRLQAGAAFPSCSIGQCPEANVLFFEEYVAFFDELWHCRAPWSSALLGREIAIEGITVVGSLVKQLQER